MAEVDRNQLNDDDPDSGPASEDAADEAPRKRDSGARTVIDRAFDIAANCLDFGKSNVQKRRAPAVVPGGSYQLVSP